MYFGETQILITLLKHPQHYYKVIGYDVTTNEEFTLSLDTHDVIELINSYHDFNEKEETHKMSIHETLDNEAEVSEIISQGLTLVQKEVQLLLLCQQKLFLEDYSNLTKEISPHLNEEKREAEGSSKDMSDEDQEVQRINSDIVYERRPQAFSQSDGTTQTNFTNNVLHEKYDCVLSGGPKSYTVGVYDASINIKKGYHSNRVLVDFKLKLNTDDEYVFKVTWIFFTLKNLEEQSIEAFSKCVNVNEENSIVVSAEKFLEPKGLYIKLHDFNKKVSIITFFKYNDQDNYSEIQIKEFDPTPNEMRNEMLELLSIRNAILNPTDLIMVPKLKKKQKDKSLVSLRRSSNSTQNSYSSNKNVFNVDQIFKEKSKGTLIFRDLYTVRYVFDINETIQTNSAQKPPEQTQPLALGTSEAPVMQGSKLQREIPCLVTFYQDSQEYDTINVEVFLRELKVSISSQVNAKDIFYEKHDSMSQKEKVKIINNLMQNMFIFVEEGNYILRIESKAPPIKEFLKEKHEPPKKAENQGEVQKLRDEKRDYIRRRERVLATLDITEDWKEESEKFEKYHVINNYLFKISAYFLESPEPESLKPMTNKGALKSQISNQSIMNRRMNMTTSQFGTTTNDISCKRLMLVDDLRDYLYGNIQGGFGDADTLHTTNRKEQVFEIICDNFTIKEHQLVLTNDYKGQAKNKYMQDATTDFMVQINKQKILEGLQLQGVGGAIYSKLQLTELQDLCEDKKIEKQIVVNQEFMFSEHLHDLKIYKYNLSSEKMQDENMNIYVLEIFEVNNPETVYTCQIDSNKFKAKLAEANKEETKVQGKACRFILETFSLNSKSTSSQYEALDELYKIYSMVLVIYEQSFPHCVLFHQELSTFFVMDNLTFVVFEPNSALKWQHNLNGILPYEYFEGDMMHKFVYDCIFKNLAGGIAKDHKLYQILDPSDKIEEITEEISDIKTFDQTSRLFCLKTYLEPDFHQEHIRPSEVDAAFYCYLAGLRDSEVRKK